MKITRVRDRSDIWERRIKVTPKRSGFSIIFRLRDMERLTKKTVYVEHTFIDATGKVSHYHVKLPELKDKSEP